MLESFDPKEIVNFLSSEQAPIVLGKLGAAVMGSDQNSWQAQVGKVAAELGQSSIANKAHQARGKAINDQNAQIVQALKTGQMPNVPATPPGQQWPTETKTVTNEEGTKTTLTYAKPDPVAQQGQAQQPQQQAAPNPAPPQSPAQTQPPAGGGAANQQFVTPGTSIGMTPQVPVALAGAGMQAPVNLTGLSPEMIGNIGRTDLGAEELKQRKVSDIYSNIYRMALTDAAARNDLKDVVPYKSLTGQTFMVNRGDLDKMYAADLKGDHDAKALILDKMAKEAGAIRDYANAEKYKAEAFKERALGIEQTRRTATLDIGQEGGFGINDLDFASIMRMGGNVTPEELRIRAANGANIRVETMDDGKGQRVKAVLENGVPVRTLGRADDPKTQQDVDAMNAMFESGIINGITDGKGNTRDRTQTDYDNFNSNSDGSRYYIPTNGDLEKPKRIDLPLHITAKSVWQESRQFGMTPEAYIEGLKRRMEQLRLDQEAGNAGR
jgi:hypothetical protein